MNQALPHFLIAGAPRAGTTWLCELLARHPDICLAKPIKPEPKFFLVDELYAKGLDHYRRTWFAEVPTGAVTGEKSSNYLESPTAAARVARDLPQVRLIFILRDPVDRAWSNWRWSTMNGLEKLPFAEALAQEALREGAYEPRHRFSRPYSYFSRGLYADLLTPWLAGFASQQLLVLRMEDAALDPARLAGRLHRFLGVTERPYDAEGLAAVNQAAGSEAGLDPDLRRSLQDRYRSQMARLRGQLGPDWTGWSWEDAR